MEQMRESQFKSGCNETIRECSHHWGSSEVHITYRSALLRGSQTVFQFLFQECLTLTFQIIFIIFVSTKVIRRLSPIH